MSRQYRGNLAGHFAPVSLGQKTQHQQEEEEEEKVEAAVGYLGPSLYIQYIGRWMRLSPARGRRTRLKLDS